MREPAGPTPVGVQGAPTIKEKNYITLAGLQRLKDEHRFLMSRERPAVVQVVAWAASNGDRSENADYLYVSAEAPVRADHAPSVTSAPR